MSTCLFIYTKKVICTSTLGGAGDSLLKLINNSSRLNKANHDCDRVWIPDLN